MGWILYHLKERGRPHKLRWYQTHKGAKIGMHAANRNAGYTAYAIMDEEHFDKKFAIQGVMNGT